MISVLPYKIKKSTSEAYEKHLEGCYMLYRDDNKIGQFHFYENPDLKYKGTSAACIGKYECAENEEASQALLEFAKNLAREKGYSWLIGPMEGSTWNNYRFSTENNSPPFFLEYKNPVYYNQQFKRNGFETIAEYLSNLDDKLNFDERELSQYEEDVLKQGGRIRKINLNNFQAELAGIAECALEGFTQNFLYTPISVSEFVDKYEKLKDYFNSDLIWIVEDAQQKTQGFIFAIQDFFDASGKTLIIKTLVRKKEAPFKGIGRFLVGKINQVAHQKGFDKIIHAYMKKDNVSVNTSRHYNGTPCKKHVLYAAKL